MYERADGTWMFSIDVGKNADGKRERLCIYAPSEKELKLKIKDERAAGGGEFRKKAKGSVGEWVHRWLEDDVKPNRSRNTYALYETMWRVHAEPTIGSLKFERVTPDVVANLYKTLRKKKASATVVHRVGVTLQRAFEVAIRRGSFHRANPFSLVERPMPRPQEQHILTVDEAKRFIEAARHDRLEALFVLLLTSGLRLGEALGLEWRDVDFSGHRLAVRQSLTEVGGSVELGATKTRGSRRSVDLGTVALEALERRRAAWSAEGHESSLIFSTLKGTPLRRSNVRRSHFEPILARAGIGRLTIHGLRHAMTSFGIAAGVAPKVLAERLGHSTVKLTEDRYAHVLPGLQREAADAIDRHLK